MAAGKGPLILSAATNWKPESKPPDNGVQGLSKEDCVTVWFFCRKVNVTVSPIAAFWGKELEGYYDLNQESRLTTEVGLKATTPPGPPTVMA